MSRDYSDERLYSEQEILDVLVGLDVVYQSQGWWGKRQWKKWHMALETIAVQLTGNELIRREAVNEVENMLREEGYDDMTNENSTT